MHRDDGAKMKTILDVNNAAGVRLRIAACLREAQDLMDSIDPDSIFGARLQQLIDEVDDPTASYDVKIGAENYPLDEA